MSVTEAEVNSLKSENASLKLKLVHYEQAYQNLTNLIHALRRQQFGKKSERFVDEEVHQTSLFDDPSKSEAPKEEKETETTEVPAHTRRKKHKRDWSSLPREVEIIPVPDADKICACGCEKSVIRYESKELLHYIPSKLYVVEQKREVVACQHGCDKSIQTAPAPKQILPKTCCTESLLAHTIVSKLHHRQPLYHLEKYGELEGLSRETMARWHIGLIEPLTPLFNLLKDSVIEYDIASIDATTLQVLNEPGRNPETKSYVYCIRGGPPDKGVILYEYNAYTHKKFVDDWFEGFKGSIHMDADDFFALLTSDEEVHAAKCNAHARRKFEKIYHQAGKPKKGLAYEALGFYKRIYKVEKLAKRGKLTAEGRYHLRLKESQSILDELKQWLDDNLTQAMPQSPIRKAMEYCLKHWPGLIHFMTDGRLEIDNNLTEQEIKPLVIARKNFMFAESVQGAHALAMHMSFIRTALLHSLNPYKYYCAILKKTPHCESVEDYEKLLPWNIVLD